MTPSQFGPKDYAYRCELLGLDPRQVHSLPEWLTPALVATTPAVRRLRSWAALMEGQWASRDVGTVRGRLHFIGSRILGDLTARVLAERLPPPVVDYLLGRVTFVG